MISIFHRTIKDRRVRKLKKFKPGAWIDVVNPSEEENGFLRGLGIDFSFIEDALDPDELPRVEREKETVYLILNVPQKERGKIFNVPLLVAVAKDIFLTLSQKPLEFRKEVLRHPQTFTTQKTKNLLRICLEITNLYTKKIRQINKQINAKKVSLSKLKNQDIAAFVELEEGLNEFITAIVAQIGVFEKIRSGKYVKIFETDEHLLEDLITDSYQCLDMCRTSIKKIINIREAYSAILSNNLNKTMKMLASLAIILGVPTIIASFYGMNVRLPLQTNPLAFFYISTATFLICLLLIIIFLLKKWL